MKPPAHSSKKRGAALVEFALVAVMTCILSFAGFEFCRLVLVYTDVASAARIGLRYAMTHGSTRNGSGGDGPATVAQIETVVRDYAKGLLNTSPSVLNIQVSYPGPGGLKAPTFPVQIAVTYNYDPWALVMPSTIKLRTVTRGIITY